MNTALSWIKSFVPGLDCTAQEYTDAMTPTGTEVAKALKDWMKILTK